ncbi:PA14 domain-containing protein [Thermoplasmatales archaeon SCGC AB-540-F20]|nr:PA14 domain-containing protein [Thermoplasmatales archaeon SCGC AB-540-F20]
MRGKKNFEKSLLTLLISLVMITSMFVFVPAIVADNGAYDYVIITTNDIVDNSEELEHFIHMKEINGYSVMVVTESDFEGLTGQYPDDRADKIRQWLIDNYVDLGIDYVLFIGDPDPDDPQDPSDHVGDIPMKMCLTTTFTPNNPGIPTDLYFGDLDSNWDIDGDGKYCEIATELTNPQSPDPSIHEDTFSAYWIGEVDCEHTKDYTFWTFSDDAVQVLIDGNLVIDNWVSHDQTIDEATISMTAGKHDIVVSYREDYFDGIIRLYWRTEVPKTDDCYIGNQLIPSDNLYDAYGSQGGLTGYYYNNPDHTEFKIERKDPQVAFFWGSGDKTTTNPDHHAEVAVGRIPVYDDNYEQLDEILRKIIDYETDDPGNIDWRKSLLLPMVPMDDITPSWGLGEALRGMAMINGFSYYRIYDEDYSSSGGPTPEIWPCTPENTYNEWQNGYGMVTWHTHGGKEGASHVIDISHLVHLDDSKPAFTFQGSCHNAWPEHKSNLAYSLLKHGGSIYGCSH